MFPFRSARQQTAREVERLLCRFFNRTATRRLFRAIDRRQEERHVDIGPVLLLPEIAGTPDTEQAQYGLTGDITVHGMTAYVSGFPSGDGTVYVGLHLEGQSHLLRSEIRSDSQVGAGFHRFGLQFLSLANSYVAGDAVLRRLIEALGDRGKR